MKADVTITAKSEDSTFKKQFQVYDDTDGVITLSNDCPTLKRLVENVIEEFKKVPEEVVIRTVMYW